MMDDDALSCGDCYDIAHDEMDERDICEEHAITDDPDDLVTWLRVQVDEDERLARAAIASPVTVFLARQAGKTIWADFERDLGPARVLRRVEVDRRILDLHAPVPTFHYDQPQCEYCASMCHSRSGLGCDSPDAPYPCDTMRLLALAYADRPGYRDEWRPA